LTRATYLCWDQRAQVTMASLCVSSFYVDTGSYRGGFRHVWHASPNRGLRTP